jgi:hypothetical protein
MRVMLGGGLPRSSVGAGHRATRAAPSPRPRRALMPPTSDERRSIRPRSELIVCSGRAPVGRAGDSEWLEAEVLPLTAVSATLTTRREGLRRSL